MTDWYFFSIAALVLLGAQRFLYKVAAERNCSSALTTAVFMGTVTLLSGAAFLASGESAGEISILLMLALVNSASFALATVAHMEALKHLPATVTFPITRLSILVVIFFSIVYFGERPQPLQMAGMLLGLSVVFVFAGEAGDKSGHRGNPRTGFLFAAACVLCGAVASISSKFAAVSTSKAGFMALSYLLGTLFALALERKNRGGKSPGVKSGEAVWIGLCMGVLNFFGFYAFLTALESGPLSVIALITGMHFVIAVALSVLLYRERMTPRRILGIGLTLLAVAFLQL
ncbi:DMT family transporter [Desulfuromonas sp. TF]|uniref:DMT family transporter n=1 Tax=Desulfuromonas sp. TF TaxID=1232410 RepID=UPI00040F8FFE|nr:DMT family transporter [Desulfuromonas sp. TF]